MHKQLKISQIAWTEKRGPAMVAEAEFERLMLKEIAKGKF